jgi:hypothetical protein
MEHRKGKPRRLQQRRGRVKMHNSGALGLNHPQPLTPKLPSEKLLLRQTFPSASNARWQSRSGSLSPTSEPWGARLIADQHFVATFAEGAAPKHNTALPMNGPDNIPCDRGHFISNCGRIALALRRPLRFIHFLRQLPISPKMRVVVAINPAEGSHPGGVFVPGSGTVPSHPSRCLFVFDHLCAIGEQCVPIV